jgi:hypothetical protein
LNSRELEPVIVPSGASLSVPLGFAAKTVIAREGVRRFETADEVAQRMVCADLPAFVSSSSGQNCSARPARGQNEVQRR